RALQHALRALLARDAVAVLGAGPWRPVRSGRLSPLHAAGLPPGAVRARGYLLRVLRSRTRARAPGRSSDAIRAARRADEPGRDQPRRRRRPDRHLSADRECLRRALRGAGPEPEA